MVLTRGLRIAAFLAVFLGAPSWIMATSVQAQPSQARGLVGTTILLVRHAEKPAEKSGGPGLIPAGEARARAYADYFRNFSFDGVPLHIDTLVATRDSRGSMRPRLTVEPFSRASGLPIQQPFADDDVKELADWIAGGAPHRTILIAWHHGKMPQLLTALGADPATLLPDSKWPPETYDWVLYLHYGEDGHLSVSRRIVEPAGLANPSSN